MTRLSHGPAVLALTATTVALCAAGVLVLTDIAALPALWTTLLISLLASLAWIDATTETVPDTLTLALVACGLIHSASMGAPFAVPLVTAALLLGLGILHDYATGDEGWIGSGDFFLTAGIAAWFGPFLLMDVLALTSIFLVLHGIVVRRASIALAPSLALSAAIIWLGGPLL